MDLAPALVPVAALLGTWRGDGAGEYPTIDPFTYSEELVFSATGKPFLHYQQRTWSPSGAPMHTETGYLRVPGEDAVELILAQPTGQTELAEGTRSGSGESDGGVLVLDLTSSVGNSASAKHVESTHRHYELVGDRLVTTFAMAAVGQPLTHHLRAELRRV